MKIGNAYLDLANSNQKSRTVLYKREVKSNSETVKEEISFESLMQKCREQREK